MHKYDEHIVCDKCGKTIGKENDRVALWGKKCNTVHLFKFFNGGLNMMDYDFCKDCAKKVEKAIENVIKEK